MTVKDKVRVLAAAVAPLVCVLIFGRFVAAPVTNARQLMEVPRGWQKGVWDSTVDSVLSVAPRSGKILAAWPGKSRLCLQKSPVQAEPVICAEVEVSEKGDIRPTGFTSRTAGLRIRR